MSAPASPQSLYVVAGFMVDLLEPWYEQGLLRAGTGHYLEGAQSSVSGSNYEQAIIAVSWVVDQLEWAFSQNWFGDFEDHLPQIIKAQAEYGRVVANWRESSALTDSLAALEAKLAELPDWFKPKTGRRAELEAQIAALVEEEASVNHRGMTIRSELTHLRRELESLGNDTQPEVDPPTT